MLIFKYHINRNSYSYVFLARSVKQAKPAVFMSSEINLFWKLKPIHWSKGKNDGDFTLGNHID